MVWGNKAKRSDRGPKACQGLTLDTSLHACWDGDQAVGSAPCACSGSTSPSRQEGQGALVPTPLCLGKETGTAAAGKGYYSIRAPGCMAQRSPSYD